MHKIAVAVLLVWVVAVALVVAIGGFLSIADQISLCATCPKSGVVR